MLNPLDRATPSYELQEKPPHSGSLRTPFNMRSVLVDGIFTSSTSDRAGFEQAYEFSLDIDHYLALYSIIPSELSGLITELISRLEGKLRLYTSAYPILINLSKNEVLRESLRAHPELIKLTREHLEDAIKLYHKPRMSDELRARFYSLTSMTLELLQHLFSARSEPFNDPEFLSWLIAAASPIFLKMPKDYETRDICSFNALFSILNHYATDTSAQHHFFLQGVVATIANLLIYSDQISTFRKASHEERALIKPLSELCVSMLQTLFQDTPLSPSLTQGERDFIIFIRFFIREWLLKEASSPTCSRALHKRIDKIFSPSLKPSIATDPAPDKTPACSPSISPGGTDTDASPAASTKSHAVVAHTFGIMLSPTPRIAGTGAGAGASFPSNES